MTDQSKPGRQDKLLQRLDAGARHQDYPEAFGESWSQLCRDAASAIRRLAAKPADEGQAVEPEELESLIANRSANRAADLIIANYIVTRPSTTGEPKR